MASNYLTNPWAGFLEENPASMFRGFLGQQRGSQNFMDYWKSRYGDVYQDYWGQLAKMAMNREAPSLDFYDYLSKYNFGSEWNKLGPRARGVRMPAGAIWNIKQ